MGSARARAIGWGVAAACAVAVLGAWAWPFTIDDAFIPCRYAENLALGRGLAWNPGERAAGVTGVAWTLALAGVRALGVRDLPAVAKGAGLSLTAGLVGWLVLRARLGAGGRRFGALVVALAVVPSLSVIAYAVAGLETAAFTLAVTAAGVLPARGRWRAAGLTAGVASAIRPEGALVLAIVAVCALAAGRPRGAPSGGVRASGRVLLVGVGPLLAAAAVSWVAFGSVLPDTLAARRAPSGAGLEYLAGALVPTGALLLWPLALVGGLTGRTRRTALAVVVGLVAAVGWFGGDWMPGWRFLVPVWPLSAWLAARGALVLAVRLRRRGAGLPERRSPRWGAGRVVAALALVGGLGLGATTTGVTLPSVRAAGLERARAAPRLVSALRALGVRHVALVDVGWVGWSGGFRTTDLAGLTDRTVAHAPGRYLDKHIEERYLLARRPDAIVLHAEGPGAAGMFPVERRVATMPAIAAAYVRVRTVRRSAHYRYVILMRRSGR